MKKILSVLIYGVLLVILVFNIFSRFNIPFLGFRTFMVASGSMEPTLKIKDLILVKESKDYKVNDIVTFNEEGYVTHRIVKIDGNNIITKGDANNTVDKAIKKNLIVGKVVYRFKVMNHIMDFIKDPFMLVMLFIIGIIITILIPDKENKV